MGKGTKDQTRLIAKPHSKAIKQSPSGNLQRLKDGVQDNDTGTGTNSSTSQVPPGVPECDVVLKGSKRFWYLEPTLFLFGIVGMIVSALLLIKVYFNSSIYF